MVKVNYIIQNTKPEKKEYKKALKSHLVHYCDVKCPQCLVGKDAMKLYIGFPKPLCPPVMHAKNDDYSLELLDQKNKYNLELRLYRRLYKNVRQPRSRPKVTVVPEYLSNLSDGTLRDPDIYFTGTYNWYYTGGLLEMVSVNNVDYFVRPTWDQKLWLTNLQNPILNYKITQNLPNTIFGIKTQEHRDFALIALRQKYDVLLLNVDANNDEMNCNSGKEFHYQIPLIDLDIFQNQISILNLKRNLTISDYEKQQPVLNFTFPENTKLPDKFCQSKFLDANTVLFMDRCCIYFLDVRSTNVEKCCLKEGFFQCNDLHAFTKNPREIDSLLLCSAHDVINFNLTQMKTIERHYHMLSEPPLIVDSIKFQDGEYVVVTGQNGTKTLLHISNDCKLYSLPNVVDTLMESSLKRSIISNENLEKRLGLSTLGTRLTDVNASIKLYTTNAYGDIFQQTISESETDNTETLNHFVQWIQLLPNASEVLEATNVFNLNDAVFSLVKETKDCKLRRYTANHSNSLENFYESDGNVVLSDNVFANTLKCAWVDDEIHTNIDTSGLPSSNDKCKVSVWLETVHQTDDELL